MNKQLKVALVGATGMVGQEFIKVLEQRKFPMQSIRLLASDRSVGRKISVNRQEIEVEELNAEAFEGIELAFFSVSAELAHKFAPAAVHAGAVVIDDSSGYRMDPNVPLVIPEVNPEDIKLHKGIIAGPNCSTIQMVVAISPLHKVNPIKRIIVDTYQSVSGTGSAAMEELRVEAKQVLEGQPTTPHVYPHQIAFNLLPEIDVFLDDGYTKEEWKMINETRKIMHANNIAISATCVRVPVFRGHSEAVHLEFTSPMPAEDAERILMQSPGIKVLDDTSVSLYPQPWPATGTDEVFVGRIRKDASHPNGLAFWVVSDNIRKGASLNAVQIAEEMLKKGWLTSRRAAK